MLALTVQDMVGLQEKVVRYHNELVKCYVCAMSTVLPLAVTKHEVVKMLVSLSYQGL